jgi:hypothetical protein
VLNARRVAAPPGPVQLQCSRCGHRFLNIAPEKLILGTTVLRLAGAAPPQPPRLPFSRSALPAPAPPPAIHVRRPVSAAAAAAAEAAEHPDFGSAFATIASAAPRPAASAEARVDGPVSSDGLARRHATSDAQEAALPEEGWGFVDVEDVLQVTHLACMVRARCALAGLLVAKSHGSAGARLLQCSSVARVPQGLPLPAPLLCIGRTDGRTGRQTGAALGHLCRSVCGRGRAGRRW